MKDAPPEASAGIVCSSVARVNGSENFSKRLRLRIPFLKPTGFISMTGKAVQSHVGQRNRRNTQRLRAFPHLMNNPIKRPTGNVKTSQASSSSPIV
jgi:hypothetical protein